MLCLCVGPQGPQEGTGPLEPELQEAMHPTLTWVRCPVLLSPLSHLQEPGLRLLPSNPSHTGSTSTPTSPTLTQQSSDTQLAHPYQQVSDARRASFSCSASPNWDTGALLHSRVNPAFSSWSSTCPWPPVSPGIQVCAVLGGGHCTCRVHLHVYCEYEQNGRLCLTSFYRFCHSLLQYLGAP